MKKLILLSGLVFIGSFTITKVGLSVIDSTESTINESSNINNTTIDDNKDTQESSISEDIIINDDLLEQYREHIRKELLDDVSEKTNENKLALEELEYKISLEIKNSIISNSLELDSEIINNIKDDLRNEIEQEIIINIKENIKSEIEQEVEKDIKDNISLEEDKITSLSNATLEVGNNLNLVYSNFKNVLENVKATDYDGTDISNDISYKIIQEGYEVDKIIDGGGDYLVIYYVTGTNNSSVIAYKKINIYIQLDINLKENNDEIFFEQSYLGLKNLNYIYNLDSYYEVNSIVKGNLVSNWNIESVDLTKNVIQHVLITVYEESNPSNVDHVNLKFVPIKNFLSGDGSDSNPFQIDDAEDLSNLQGKDLYANFILTNSFSAASLGKFNSIKSIQENYLFDGNNKLISDLELPISYTSSYEKKYISKKALYNTVINAYSGIFLAIYGDVNNLNTFKTNISGTIDFKCINCLINISVLSPYVEGNLYNNEITNTYIDIVIDKSTDIKLSVHPWHIYGGNTHNDILMYSNFAGINTIIVDVIGTSNDNSEIRLTPLNLQLFKRISIDSYITIK